MKKMIKIAREVIDEIIGLLVINEETASQRVVERYPYLLLGN